MPRWDESFEVGYRVCAGTLEASMAFQRRGVGFECGFGVGVYVGFRDKVEEYDLCCVIGERNGRD